MILIVVKFPVRPEVADQFVERVAEFTAATRAEPGNVSFEWSRSVDDSDTYVLVEAFREAAAGEAHVRSAHFQQALVTLAALVADTPEIVYVDSPDAAWGPMAEIQPTS